MGKLSELRALFLSFLNSEAEQSTTLAEVPLKQQARRSPGSLPRGISGCKAIDPLAKAKPYLTKPLIVVVHGDTWKMADELFLVADIRVAATNRNFGQDENTHGRFPGGGSTVRFVREAGWGNAMRYMLTGDHWSAQEAYGIGTVQEIADTQAAAIDRAVEIANQIAACGPLGVQATLASLACTPEGVGADQTSDLLRGAGSGQVQLCE